MPCKHAPQAFLKLVAQTPPEGSFDYDALEWTAIKYHGDRLVAAVPADRIQDFVDGESFRGGSQINARERGQKHKHVLRDDHYACYCGKHTRKDQRDLAAAGCRAVQASQASMSLAPASQPAVRADSGKKARRRRTEHGQSIKQGCLFAFVAKVYTGLPDTAYLVFTAASAAHVNSQGEAVHPDRSAGRPLSEACRQWVVTRLLLGVVSKTILAGATLHARWSGLCT